MIFRDKINKVDAWMSYRQLPGSLRSDITGYYANSCSPPPPSCDCTFPSRSSSAVLQCLPHAFCQLS